MKNIIYIKKLDFISLCVLLFKVKRNFSIFTLEKNFLLIDAICKLLKIKISVVNFNMGSHYIGNEKFHFWSLGNQINERLTNYIFNNYEKNLNYINSINKNINFEKKISILKKDIDIENRDLILLYLLCLKHSSSEKNNFYIAINNNFISDIRKFFEDKKQINFINKVQFNIIKKQFSFMSIIILHLIFFLPSLLLSLFKKNKKSKKIACKFEKGLEKQYFPDFVWINNLSKYKNKLILYNDEIIYDDKYNRFKNNVEIFKKNNIKFININPLNNPLNFQLYKHTRFFSNILFYKYFINQIRIFIYIIKNFNNPLLMFNLKLLINKIPGIEYYLALIKTENISIIFDYAERHHDNLSIACDLNNTIKIGLSWSLKTQKVASFRNTQDIYFTWSKQEIEIFKKSSLFPKYISTGCFFANKNSENYLSKNKINKFKTIGIMDRSINKNSAMSEIKYYKFFENLIEYVENYNISILIKPNNDNFEVNLKNNIKNFDLIESLKNKNKIKIYKYNEGIEVLNDANYCIALGINSAGIISNINGLLTFFLDLENHYDNIDENLKSLLIKEKNVFFSLKDILKTSINDQTLKENITLNFYQEDSLKKIEDTIFKLYNANKNLKKEDIIKKYL